MSSDFAAYDHIVIMPKLLTVRVCKNWIKHPMNHSPIHQQKCSSAG